MQMKDEKKREKKCENQSVSNLKWRKKNANQSTNSYMNVVIK